MNQKELTEKLVAASEAYYAGSPVMPDIEFDHLVEELAALEKESGVVFEGSPTMHVGAAAVNALKKVRHEMPALSLDKVKYVDREKLVGWLQEGGKYGTLSWKMDGLTVVVTYDSGKLIQAVTRGNGEEGSDITHNAVWFTGLPERISYKGHLVVRGEAVMQYWEFDRVNDLAGGIYENPRNLAASTVQMLDPEESRKRKIWFYAFELVDPAPTANSVIVSDDGNEWCAWSMSGRFDWLKNLGFNVVEHKMVKPEELLDTVEEFKDKLGGLDFPTDGLVLSYDNVAAGWELGSTGHHPRWAMALKWSDETVETTIRDIVWSVGKTGVITPVAVFDPVRLGAGSTVQRASLHNISIMDGLKTKIGAKAQVYLANMIIPQVASCDGNGSDVEIPSVCPICGSGVHVETENGIKVLHCYNKKCPARVRRMLENAFSKDGLFIKGLGPSQIEDLQNAGLIGSHPKDVFEMLFRSEDPDFEAGKEKIFNTTGWGKKSWARLITAIEEGRNTDLRHFLYSLGVPMLGHDLSKKLDKLFLGKVGNFIDFVINPDVWFLMNDDGIGEVKAGYFVDWCKEVKADKEKFDALLALIGYLKFDEPEVPKDSSLAGMTFVITGAVHDYKNRDEFKASVEARGGKVAGSVSKKTDYLVSNDADPSTGKGAKAKALNVAIISEDEFIAKFGR